MKKFLLASLFFVGWASFSFCGLSVLQRQTVLLKTEDLSFVFGGDLPVPCFDYVPKNCLVPTSVKCAEVDCKDIGGIHYCQENNEYVLNEFVFPLDEIPTGPQGFVKADSLLGWEKMYCWNEIRCNLVDPCASVNGQFKCLSTGIVDDVTKLVMSVKPTGIPCRPGYSGGGSE